MGGLTTWFAERREGVPGALWREIEACAAPYDAVGDSPIYALSSAVGAQMRRMRDCSCTSRDDALALLTTDALVTYVLELAASRVVARAAKSEVLSDADEDAASNEGHVREEQDLDDSRLDASLDDVACDLLRELVSMSHDIGNSSGNRVPTV